MSASVIQGIAERLKSSDPASAPSQREIFEQLRNLRAAFDGPLDPESQRCLEAASMLVAYLARMGTLAGDDVRAIALRLLERAAVLEVATTPGTVLASPGAHPKLHVIRPGETASATPTEDQPRTPEPAAPRAESTMTDLMGDMMLGQILLRRGQILEEHIHQAMKVQRATSMRIGDVLVKIGAATRAQLDDALSYQASCRRVRENLGESAASELSKPADTRGTGLKLMGEMLLGEVLIERGVITRRQLERALEVQKQSGIRVGEALVKIGATTIEHIEHALRVQGHDRKFSKPAPGAGERRR